MIARCPFCKSIWVCWNWCHWTKERLTELNPTLPKHTTDEWCHECHADACSDDTGCGSVHITNYKVRNGVPYWLLMLYGKWRWRK